MSIGLSPAISDYFIADQRRDPKAVSECFTGDAVVKDEGQTYNGRDAIEQWVADTYQKYTCTVEPFAIATKDDRMVVTSHLAGNFPGSPIDLRYMFVLAGDKIASLDIVL